MPGYSGMENRPTGAKLTAPGMSALAPQVMTVMSLPWRATMASCWRMVRATPLISSKVSVKWAILRFLASRLPALGRNRARHSRENLRSLANRS